LYDPKAEPKEFVGETRAEAVAKACGFFRREESELHVRELEEGRAFGLASRVAIVAFPQATPKRERSGPKRGGEPAANEGVESQAASDSVGTTETPLSEMGEFVLGLIERMGTGSFEIRESQDGENLIFQLRGTAALKLMSGDGRAAGAIQLLVNQVAMRRGEEPRRVILDVEGSAERRVQYLERVAERAARRAKESGRGVALEPMNPRDRRTVHVALRDSSNIATMSVGEGRYRQVVVVPEGAPEFEEAQQYEPAARERDE
jgi:spoIIIJ-associated protein